MISPQKLAANRRNALKSTGPKTEAGKARSRGNAETHGLTALHPGEPSASYRQALAEWVEDLRPRGVVEQTLVERACRAAWNLRRCDRFEDATAFVRDRDAADTFDRDEANRAEAIGRHLFAWCDGEDDSADSDEAIDEPTWLVGELRRSLAGVQWLLARWTELREALKGKGWTQAHVARAACLLGLRPEEVETHAVLGRVEPVSTDWESPPGGGSWHDVPGFDEALETSEQRDGDREDGSSPYLDAWMRRAAAEAQPAMSGTDRKRLAAMVRAERDKLSRRQNRALMARHEDDRAGAADRTRFDEPRSLALCLRYGGAASRDLHRSLRELARRKEAREAEAEESDLTQPVISEKDAASSEIENSGPCGAVAARNEPTEEASRHEERVSSGSALAPHQEECAAANGALGVDEAEMGFARERGGSAIAVPTGTVDVLRIAGFWPPGVARL